MEGFGKNCHTRFLQNVDWKQTNDFLSTVKIAPFFVYIHSWVLYRIWEAVITSLGTKYDTKPFFPSSNKQLRNVFIMLLWKKKLAWTPITTKFGDFSNSGFFNPHSNFFCIVQINKEITRGVFCTLPLLILKIILNLGIIFFWTQKMCSNLQRILPIKKKILDTCLVPKVWCLQELGQRWCCWRSWWGSQYLSPSSTLLCALQGGFFLFYIINFQFILLFILLIVKFELSIVRAKTDVVIFNEHFVLCLLVSGRISANTVLCHW